MVFFPLLAQHLICLLEQYLEPLRNENFLSATEMMAIFGNIREMVGVQRRFLKSLEAAVESGTPVESINHPSEFKVSWVTANLGFLSSLLSGKEERKLVSQACSVQERKDVGCVNAVETFTQKYDAFLPLFPLCLMRRKLEFLRLIPLSWTFDLKLMVMVQDFEFFPLSPFFR